jgi:hypothetical protein
MDVYDISAALTSAARGTNLGVLYMDHRIIQIWAVVVVRPLTCITAMVLLAFGLVWFKLRQTPTWHYSK